MRLEWRARVEAQALRRELVDKQREVEANVRETRRAQAENEQIRRNYESTLSWRVTRGLRAARALIDRLRRRPS